MSVCSVSHSTRYFVFAAACSRSYTIFQKFVCCFQCCRIGSKVLYQVRTSVLYRQICTICGVVWSVWTILVVSSRNSNRLTRICVCGSVCMYLQQSSHRRDSVHFVPLYSSMKNPHPVTSCWDVTPQRWYPWSGVGVLVDRGGDIPQVLLLLLEYGCALASSSNPVLQDWFPNESRRRLAFWRTIIGESWWWYSPSSEIETNISDEFNRCRVLSYACMDCVDEKEGMAVVLLLQKHLYLTLLIEEENIFISESNEFQTQI